MILDEYVKNRDVWRCPSARFEKGVLWVVPGPDWLQYLKDWEGGWGIKADNDRMGGPCVIAWPPGWGGTVTDTLAQQMQASGSTGHFALSIGTVSTPSLKLASVQDPVWYVCVGEQGVLAEDISMPPGLLAFPDICAPECNGCEGGCDPDCNFTEEEYTDPSLRTSQSRHLGGVNVGFLDGHASWFHSTRLLDMSPRWSNGVCAPGSSGSDPACGGRLVQRELGGLVPWGPTSPADGGTPMWETEGCDIAANGPLY